MVSSLVFPITVGLNYWTLELFSEFNPLSLFANGEQGVWFDPNDFSTLFQDISGTTPVTAAGQPVRLIRDKSGRGNHITFLSDAARPLLKLNATTGAYYLESDGVDDGGVTAAINFTGTDKVSAFTGIRKISDATSAVVFELSVDAGLSNGSFSLLAPSASGANSYRFTSRGTLLQVAGTGVFAAAPNTSVITGVGDISGDSVLLLANGAVIETTTGNQGAGNYGTYPLYLFRRGGTTAPWAGHFYGLIIVSRLLTAVETSEVNKMFAKYTGVTLP